MKNDKDLLNKIDSPFDEIDPNFSKMKRGFYGLFQICMVCRIKIIVGDFSFPKIEKKDTDNFIIDSMAGIQDEKTKEKILKQYEQERDAFLKKDDPVRELISLDIRNTESFNSMGKYCLFILDALYTPPRYPNVFLFHFDLFTCAVAKVWELIGYWTAKMEEKEKNTKSAKVKSDKKREKKETISSMFKKIPPGDKDAEKNMRIRAMQLFNCTENNIRSLVKEIKNGGVK